MATRRGRTEQRNNAVVYVRVSTIEQVDNYSLSTQEKACRQYCEREGMTVLRVFREEGESAKTADRPVLQEMLAYCASKAQSDQIGTLVVYRVDRLARNSLDHGSIRALLGTRKIRIRSASEVFDDSPTGNFAENIMAAVAQLDNEMRGQRASAGMKEAIYRGRWVWRIPIGYQRSPEGESSSMTPDPFSAPIVRLAFDRMASGSVTKAQVLQEVNAMGLRTGSGRSLTAQSFGNLLRNPIYTGRIVVPSWGYEGPGDFTGLVERETFDQVQKILDGRSSSPERRFKDHPDFPLRRVLRCSSCGGPLTASWSKGRTKTYGYYRCHRKDCGATKGKREAVEEKFTAFLASQSVRPEVFKLLAAVVEDVWTERTKSSVEARSTLEVRERALRGKQDKLVDAYLEGRGIAQKTYEAQMQRLDQELAEVQQQIASVTLTNMDLTRTLDFAQQLLVDLPSCWNRLEWQEKPRFLESLYPKGLVYSHEGIGTVEMPWYMKGNHALKHGELDWAVPTGFEPVSSP